MFEGLQMYDQFCIFVMPHSVNLSICYFAETETPSLLEVVSCNQKSPAQAKGTPLWPTMSGHVRSFMLWSCIHRNFPTTTWTRNEQTEQRTFNRSVVSFGGTIWLLLFLRRVCQDRFQNAIKTWICRLSLSPAYISSANMCKSKSWEQRNSNEATITHMFTLLPEVKLHYNSTDAMNQTYTKNMYNSSIHYNSLQGRYKDEFS